LFRYVYHNMRRGISGLLIVGLAVGLLAGCAGKGKPPAAVTKKQAPKQEKTAVKAEFHKAHISWADAKGRPVMEASFKEAVASSNGDTAIVELVGVKADLFRDGKPASSLRAERIVADSRKKEIRAAGNIRITSRDGSSAQCERATWKSSANKIIGSGGVKLTKGNITITADRFEADTGLKHVRFYQGKAEVR
jgi:LPS export ABC transporter protein LptC